MANIIGRYKMAWRFIFDVSPFNELDNAVFFHYSIYNFEDLQNEINSIGVSLADACRCLITHDYHYGYMSEINVDFLNAFATSERFGNVMVLDYIDLYHEKNINFRQPDLCMTTVRCILHSEEPMTDELSLERRLYDEFFSYSAQKFALDFLKQVISRHPNTDFIVGGHSKAVILQSTPVQCVMNYLGIEWQPSIIMTDLTLYEVINTDIMNAIKNKIIKIVPDF